MFYEYKDVPEDVTDISKWCKSELKKAILHDPIVHNMYNLFWTTRKKYPFDDIEFYMMLAYNVLKMLSKERKERLHLILQ